MKTTIKIIGFLFITIFISTSAFASADIDRNAFIKKIPGLQIPFIENQGQIKNKSVRFYASTFAGTVFITDKGEIVYSLIKSENSEAGSEKLKLRDKDIKSETLRSELQTPNSNNTKEVTIKESTTDCTNTWGVLLTITEDGLPFFMSRSDYDTFTIWEIVFVFVVICVAWFIKFLK